MPKLKEGNLRLLYDTNGMDCRYFLLPKERIEEWETEVCLYIDEIDEQKESDRYGAIIDKWHMYEVTAKLENLRVIIE